VVVYGQPAPRRPVDHTPQGRRAAATDCPNLPVRRSSSVIDLALRRDRVVMLMGFRSPEARSVTALRSDAASDRPGQRGVADAE
jgi:hypothetical protein